MAYAASALGHETVADAIADPVVLSWVQQWWDASAPHLPLPAADSPPGLPASSQPGSPTCADTAPVSDAGAAVFAAAVQGSPAEAAAAVLAWLGLDSPDVAAVIGQQLTDLERRSTG